MSTVRAAWLLFCLALHACAPPAHSGGAGRDAAGAGEEPDASAVDAAVAEREVGLRALDFPEEATLFSVKGISADGSTVFGWAQVSRATSVWRGKMRALAWSSASGLRSPDAGAKHDSNALAITQDGATILVAVIPEGRSGLMDVQSFAWSRDALERIELPVGTVAALLNHDGTVHAGVTRDGSHVYRWTEASGLVDIGRLRPDSCDDPNRADAPLCATGPATPPALPIAMSADGNVIIGYSDNDAFRWSPETGMERLARPEGATSVRAWGMSADGQVLVGTSSTGIAGEQRTVRWTPDGVESLGHLDAAEPTHRLDGAVAANVDGSVIVGASGGQAMIWDAHSGMRALRDVLAEQGVEVGGWTLHDAVDVSDDGRTIVGSGTYDGRLVGYVATLR